MSAKITDKLKRDLLKDLYDQFLGEPVSGSIPAIPAKNHYIGISRSEDWDSADLPPTPNSSVEDSRGFQSSLQSIKKVEDVSYVVPRYNWTAGTVYTPWDNNNSSDTTVGSRKDIAGPSYVITDQNNVYVCLQQGMTTEGTVKSSVTRPSVVPTTPADPDTTAIVNDAFGGGAVDGYVWKFMFNVGTYNSRRYLTSNYIPVEQVPMGASDIGYRAPANLSASRKQQYSIQKTARDIANNETAGQILSIAVVNGGTGYSPTVGAAGTEIRIYPDANTYPTHGGNLDAAAHALVDANGSIYQIIMKADTGSAAFSFGRNYNENCWVEVLDNRTGAAKTGSGAILRPIVCTDGLGIDPRKDLNSSALMYTTRLVGDESGFFPSSNSVKNSYRQVGLIKNPLVDAAVPSVLFNSLRGNARKKLQVLFGSGIDTTKITENIFVSGPAPATPATDRQAKAVVDYYKQDSDGSGGVVHNLYVHQTMDTGWQDFQFSDALTFSNTITGVAVPVDGTVTTLASGVVTQPLLKYADVDNFSGEVCYIDNRASIERDSDQTEDIKIIIDL